jgi:hypothetical protein
LRREQNDNVSELPSNAISRLLIGAGLVGQISCCGRGAAHCPLPDPPPRKRERERRFAKKAHPEKEEGRRRRVTRGSEWTHGAPHRYEAGWL